MRSIGVIKFQIKKNLKVKKKLPTKIPELLKIRICSPNKLQTNIKEPEDNHYTTTIA